MCLCLHCEYSHISAGDGFVEADLVPAKPEHRPVGEPTADVWSWEAFHCVHTRAHTHTHLFRCSYDRIRAIEQLRMIHDS